METEEPWRINARLFSGMSTRNLENLAEMKCKEDESKPRPEILPETEGFWKAAARHELAVQCCGSCGQNMHFPRLLCHRCLSDQLTWKNTSGHGVIYSYTIIRQAADKRFAGDVPYVYAIVELEEGVRMISNVININPSEVRIGMDVQVVFKDLSEELSIPMFEPTERRRM